MDPESSRWSEKEDLFPDFPLFSYIDPVNKMEKSVLKKLRRYVKEIDKYTFDKYKYTYPYECRRYLLCGDSCSASYEECWDCGGDVGSICKKCKPKQCCHYCGGYDANFFRNDKYPCIVWCTPSHRYIPNWDIRPLGKQNPILSLRTRTLNAF